MRLEALLPYIMPNVLGCPEPVVEHHARLAAIEFCEKTRWHEEACPVDRVGDTGVYELSPENGADISRISSVSVNGVRYHSETTPTGSRLIDAKSRDCFFVMLSPSEIAINPAPALADSVYVVASFRPTTNTTNISDLLVEWRDGIASGAIARITVIPGQPFSNPDLARYHRAVFDDAVRTASAKKFLGSSESRTPKQIQTF